jgi:hypothetical protein
MTSHGFHVFLPGAAAHVTRMFWPPRKPGARPWFLFGGCLFWVVLIYFVAGLYALRAAVWAVLIILLAVAQGVSLAGELAWWPVRLIGHQGAA